MTIDCINVRLSNSDSSILKDNSVNFHGHKRVIIVSILYLASCDRFVACFPWIELIDLFHFTCDINRRLIGREQSKELHHWHNIEEKAY